MRVRRHRLRGALVDIPDDFPLAAGWPDDSAAEPGPRYGLRGPDRSLDSLAWTLCEESFTATGVRDRLRADWHNVEDYRGRELLTFPTPTTRSPSPGDRRVLGELPAAGPR